MKKQTNKKILDALEKTGGLIKPAASRLGVARNTLYTWIQNSKELTDGLLSIRDGMVDMAEGALFKQVSEDNTTAIIFMLKTLGKERGYIEHKQERVDDSKLTIEIIKIKRDETDEDET